MPAPIRPVLLLFVVLLFLSGRADALQAGLRQGTIAGTPVALYYPTQTPARSIPMGPFTPQVALHGVPEPSFKGLILLSHGIGGSELGHGRLAEGLARAGYLVAALRHPGDNWQDHTLVQSGPAAYFHTRPRQVSAVLDALLNDPQWKDRIAQDAQGPKVGAIGHSAGGYTVLALAGGVPDLGRLARHCAQERAADPVFCRTGQTGSPGASASPAADPGPALADRRVRAVAALAPVGAVFDDRSLAAITIPVAIYQSDRDSWLVPRFHAGRIARALPAARLHRVPDAGHFAFMDTPSMAVTSEDGDIRADPAGFDRAAFLARLAIELPAFFDQALR
jgi:predicted dienelactone hydrolase